MLKQMIVIPLAVVLICSAVWAKDELAGKFIAPPAESRVQCFWWWLNGNVTKETITSDLEAMKEKGFGGALIVDAGGATQDGNGQVPHGPVFASPEWRELYRHALKEAARLKLELALNIQSGWNLGGPEVTGSDAAKILCWSDVPLTGADALVEVELQAQSGFLRDVAVLAIPVGGDYQQAEGITNLPKKTLMAPVHGGNGDTAAELAPTPVSVKVRGIDPSKVIDISKCLDADGRVKWIAPAGKWRLCRFYYTVGPGAHVSTCSPGWEGLAIDPMDAGAFQRFWNRVIEPLILDAVKVEEHPLKYVHTDSWEIEPFNWTPGMREEFQKRRGYNMTPWLPVFARQVVGGLEASERFLHDFRNTVAELTAENYYGPFMENAHRHGLQVRAESGGPHGVPIDAQHCLGIIDAPMSEFWATSWRHRVPLEKRFFVKQPASAAHTYGRQIVAAEGFTTIGPHWQETVWDNLKPNFDRAICEGMNQLVYHGFGVSLKDQGLPGQSYFAGTHINPNVTWWKQSEGFFSYINRCQWMVRQGLFVADVLYYYGDLAPNFAGLKLSNPAGLPPGYDYDVATEYVLLNRLSVREGRMTLPDGMSYAALVLPPDRCISLRVLRKLEELTKAGGPIVGPKPDASSGLKDWQKDGDREAKERIGRLWGEDGMPGPVKQIKAVEWLKQKGLAPDCAVSGGVQLDWIHRRCVEADIYFMSHLESNKASATVSFRIAGRKPELWDAVTGKITTLPDCRRAENGSTEVSLQFEPYGSCFVVFRNREEPTACAIVKKTPSELKPVRVMKEE